jgi:hypothetical protein
VAAAGIALITALGAPVAAQQPAERTPTVKDPIGFEAFAVQMNAGASGVIWTANSIGWDLRYAKEFHLPDGTRQVVLATDKPVSFAAAYADSESLDYPFGLVEMRFPKDSNKGEGKLLARTAVSTKNGRLEFELYGSEAIRLTTITESTK